MGIGLDTYIITSASHGSFEVQAEDIFHALENIQKSIEERNLNLNIREELSFKTIKILEAYVINFNTDYCINIIDFL